MPHHVLRILPDSCSFLLDWRPDQTIVRSPRGARENKELCGGWLEGWCWCLCGYGDKISEKFGIWNTHAFVKGFALARSKASIWIRHCTLWPIKTLWPLLVGLEGIQRICRSRRVSKCNMHKTRLLPASLLRNLPKVICQWPDKNLYLSFFCLESPGLNLRCLFSFSTRHSIGVRKLSAFTISSLSFWNYSAHSNEEACQAELHLCCVQTLGVKFGAQNDVRFYGSSGVKTLYPTDSLQIHQQRKVPSNEE